MAAQGGNAHLRDQFHPEIGRLRCLHLQHKTLLCLNLINWNRHTARFTISVCPLPAGKKLKRASGSTTAVVFDSIIEFATLMTSFRL